MLHDYMVCKHVGHINRGSTVFGKQEQAKYAGAADIIHSVLLVLVSLLLSQFEWYLFVVSLQSLRLKGCTRIFDKRTQFSQVRRIVLL